MPYEYTLLSSDIPNAFALPGGKIYVTAGLFKHMRNERQLAAVLAHETVHVAARHSVQGLQNQMGAALFTELLGMIVGGEGAETARAGSEFATGMVTLHYGRDDESESDRYGLKYMQHAGYNPWGMVELLELLQSLSKSKPGLFKDWFMTHPLTSTRINDVRGILPRSYPSYSGRTPDPHTKRFMQMRELLLSATKK
jgi:predicted Zn-dependent protease